MKPPRAILTSILALTLATPYLHAQATPFNGSTSNINPDPAKCCDCVSMIVSGDYVPDYSDPKSPKNLLYPDVNGNYWAVVDMYVFDNAKCAPAYDYTITATVGGSGKLLSAMQQSKTGLVEKIQPDKRVFKLEPRQARVGDKWSISFQCGVGNDSPDESPPSNLKGTQARKCGEIVEFELRGCKSCDCPTGPPKAVNGSFQASIPLTKSNGGDTDGQLVFVADGFTNAGRSALFANLPVDVAVTRDGNGHITSVITGTNTLEVSAADAGLLTLDPNAFKVVHKDKSGIEFRTTTISLVVDGGESKFRMDSFFDGSTIRYEQTKPQPDTYVMEQGRVVGGVFQALSRETLHKPEPTGNTRVQRVIQEERASSGVSYSVVSDVESTWEKQLTGWRKTKEIVEPNGAALTSTWTYYQPGEITGPNGASQGLGHLKHAMRYDGYEAFYAYSLHQTTITTPYAGNPTGQVETTTWDPVTKTTTSTITVGGQIKSKTTTIHTDTTETNIVYTSGAGTLTTVTHYIPSGQDFGGKPTRVVRPDGTITTYSYTRNAGGGYTTVIEEGSTTNSTSIAKGTRTTTTTNAYGTTILTQIEAIGSGTGTANFGSMAVTEVDSLGRALTTAHNSPSPSVAGEVAIAPGASWSTKTFYSCCGVAKETDMYGISTFYAYDHLQRQIKTNRLGVTTETVRKGTLDSEGKPLVVTETHRYPESVDESVSPASYASAANLVSRSVTNLAGTIQESWSPDPTPDTRPDPINDPPRPLIRASLLTTTYKPATGLSTRTVTTTPDNFSQTTDSFLDGRTAATYGALSPTMAHTYAVNSTGEVSSQSYVDGTTLRETTTTQSDWAGRTLSTTLMDGAVASMHYNSKGQLVRMVDPDQIVTLYAYNAEGERTTSATDLFPSSTYNDEVDNIAYGVDTVSYSETDPANGTILASIGSETVMKTISQVWKPGDSAPTVVSTSMRSSDGLRSSSQAIGVAAPSISVTTLGSAGSWTSKSTSPDGTGQLQTYSGGLLVSSSSLLTSNSALHTTSYAYDTLNRPITSTDSRTGATTTNYLSTTSDVVTSITAPGNRTTVFTYDVRGRRTQVDAPDSVDADNNPLLNVTSTSYNPDSTVAETTGDQTYRTTHTYDYAQRQVTMTTYGSTTATTTWTYSPTRGFLTRKAYHDGKGTDYTYTAAGRLSTRGWARAVGTSYAYDAGGRLITTTYSDDTPDVSVSYDCLGRQITQSNGTATTSYTYDPATLALDTETIAYDLDPNTPGPEFTRILDRSRDTLQRDTGWKVGTIAQYNAGWIDVNNDSDLENSVAYTYGPTDGRLASVSGGGFPPPSPFHYSYIPNSNLIESVTGPTHTVTNTWEATRDVLAFKENKVGTTVISGYTYNVNHLGQRTGVSQAGTAFQAVQSVDWRYNNKGEVVKADSSVNASDRSYQYDGIGNRLQGSAGVSPAEVTTYTPNALNQYSSLTINSQQSTLNPSYDDDGNMTSGPLPANLSANSTLTWDAENRLISTTVNGITTTYQYDSQSRRIAQSLTINNQLSTIIYLYDGWNSIAEYSAFTLSKTYTWGMDLSGSMQGAGGVGGLLAVTDSTGSYFPTFDGNGNISEYLDATGAIAAHYEYDPFGRETVSNGTNPTGFTHRFSTKPIDAATGLYYYGYRWYDPVTGRWPSRDPIAERGGINLYGFVGNDGVNKRDILGLQAKKKCCTIRLFSSSPSEAAVTDKTLNVAIETGHTWIDYTDFLDGNYSVVVFSFGPTEPIGESTIVRFVMGMLKGNTDYPTGKYNITAKMEWVRYDGDEDECRLAKRKILSAKSKQPLFYTPSYQCTSAALSLLKEIGVDPPAPDGVGPVVVIRNGITEWGPKDVTNPYHLSKQINEKGDK